MAMTPANLLVKERHWSVVDIGFTFLQALQENDLRLKQFEFRGFITYTGDDLSPR